MQSKYTGTTQSASISGGSFQEQGLGSELHVFKLAHTETRIRKQLFPRHSENNCSEPICLATQEVHSYNMGSVPPFPNSWMKMFGSPPFTLSSRLGWTSGETNYFNEAKWWSEAQWNRVQSSRLQGSPSSYSPHFTFATSLWGLLQTHQIRRSATSATRQCGHWRFAWLRQASCLIDHIPSFAILQSPTLKILPPRRLPFRDRD